MVLTTIADGVLDVAQGIYDTGADLFGETTIRLGVTGLARSGKTVFITSLVANLLDSGRMPHLLAASEGRIAAAYLQPQPDDTVPRFDYETHIGMLTGHPPSWPDSTRAVSELRVSLRIKPNGLLAGLQGPRTIHLDIIDYPGEWLLDLGLLDQSYEQWSASVLARLEDRECADDFRAALGPVEGADKLDEVQAKTLAAAFTDYLHAARAAGFYDCTPAASCCRGILPGRLSLPLRRCQQGMRHVVPCGGKWRGALKPTSLALSAPSFATTLRASTDKWFWLMRWAPFTTALPRSKTCARLCRKSCPLFGQGEMHS